MNLNYSNLNWIIRILIISMIPEYSNHFQIITYQSNYTQIIFQISFHIIFWIKDDYNNFFYFIFRKQHNLISIISIFINNYLKKIIRQQSYLSLLFPFPFNPTKKSFFFSNIGVEARDLVLLADLDPLLEGLLHAHGPEEGIEPGLEVLQVELPVVLAGVLHVLVVDLDGHRLAPLPVLIGVGDELQSVHVLKRALAKIKIIK